MKKFGMADLTAVYLFGSEKWERHFKLFNELLQERTQDQGLNGSEGLEMPDMGRENSGEPEVSTLSSCQRRMSESLLLSPVDNICQVEEAVKS